MSWSKRLVLGAIIACAAFDLSTQRCFGWSESGHRLIASIAFREMRQERRSELLARLKDHPNYHPDFQVPSDVPADGKDEWLFGRAAVWPNDLVDTERDRPLWRRHPSVMEELGTRVELPDPFEKPPSDASLKSTELQLSQDLAVCRRIAKSNDVASERAIALCWLMHLVGEAHQPCNAGSLYADGVFEKGDDFGSAIQVTSGENLHAVWDGLFGERCDNGKIFRLREELRQDQVTWERAIASLKSPRSLEVICWLLDSSSCAPSIYADVDVIQPIEAARKSGRKLMPLVLSEKYLRRARALAMERAILAGLRLGAILSEVE